MKPLLVCLSRIALEQLILYKKKPATLIFNYLCNLRRTGKEQILTHTWYLSRKILEDNRLDMDILVVKTSNQFFNPKVSSQNLQFSGRLLSYKRFSIEIIGGKK